MLTQEDILEEKRRISGYKVKTARGIEYVAGEGMTIPHSEATLKKLLAHRKNVLIVEQLFGEHKARLDEVKIRDEKNAAQVNGIPYRYVGHILGKTIDDTSDNQAIKQVFEREKLCNRYTYLAIPYGVEYKWRNGRGTTKHQIAVVIDIAKNKLIVIDSLNGNYLKEYTNLTYLADSIGCTIKTGISIYVKQNPHSNLSWECGLHSIYNIYNIIENTPMPEVLEKLDKESMLDEVLQEYYFSYLPMQDITDKAGREVRKEKLRMTGVIESIRNDEGKIVTVDKYVEHEFREIDIPDTLQAREELVKIRQDNILLVSNMLNIEVFNLKRVEKGYIEENYTTLNASTAQRDQILYRPVQEMIDEYKLRCSEDEIGIMLLMLLKEYSTEKTLIKNFIKELQEKKLTKIDYTACTDMVEKELYRLCYIATILQNLNRHDEAVTILEKSEDYLQLGMAISATNQLRANIMLLGRIYSSHTKDSTMYNKNIQYVKKIFEKCFTLHKESNYSNEYRKIICQILDLVEILNLALNRNNLADKIEQDLFYKPYLDLEQSSLLILIKNSIEKENDECVKYVLRESRRLLCKYDTATQIDVINICIKIADTEAEQEKLHYVNQAAALIRFVQLDKIDDDKIIVFANSLKSIATFYYLQNQMHEAYIAAKEYVTLYNSVRNKCTNQEELSKAYYDMLFICEEAQEKLFIKGSYEPYYMLSPVRQIGVMKKIIEKKSFNGARIVFRFKEGYKFRGFSFYYLGLTEMPNLLNNSHLDYYKDNILYELQDALYNTPDAVKTVEITDQEYNPVKINDKNDRKVYVPYIGDKHGYIKQYIFTLMEIAIRNAVTDNKIDIAIPKYDITKSKIDEKEVQARMKRLKELETSRRKEIEKDQAEAERIERVQKLLEELRVSRLERERKKKEECRII